MTLLIITLVEIKVLNIDDIGNIGSPKTRKFRWKYQDIIDNDKNYENCKKNLEIFIKILQDVCLVKYLLVYYKKN